MNKQLRLFIYFAMFMLIVQCVSLVFSSSQFGVRNSILVAGAGSTFNFGNTAIGTILDQNDLDAKSASAFTCGSNGQITDIYAYVARVNSAGTGKAAIYADSSGQPGSLIAQSNAASISTSYSWVDFQLPSPAIVTSGMVYWLAICSDDILNLYTVTGSGVRVHNGNIYSQGFSDPFGSVWGTSNSGAMSIYASGNQSPPPVFNFSIMQISDTQNLAWDHPDWYSQLATWIVNNNATYNLKMVIHTGDIVDQCDDYSQWQNANASMSILANSGIPYTWDAGNHDQSAQNVSGDPNTGWFGIQYAPFNPATFSNRSYWVGDLNQGKDTAVKFSFGGYNFLVINLECQANATTMAWATALLDTYSSLNYNIIVATHAYLDSPNMLFLNNLPSTPVWEENLQSLLDSYPRVFMTLNGHTGGWPVGLSVHNQVNGRTQTEFDRQDAEIDEAAAVRIYSFDLNGKTVTASTYSVPSSTWITDLGNSFSFSADLKSIPTATVTPTVVRVDLGQSQTFSSSVSGGTAPYSYQWYLNDTAVSGAIGSTWTFTPNAAGQYKVYVNVTDSLNVKFQSNKVSDIIVYPSLSTSVSPTSVNMTVGNMQQFNSTVSGGFVPYIYQWFYVNGTAITGATNSTLTYKANSTGTYTIYLNVTDNLNSKVKSNNATLNIYSQPTVTINPTSVNMTVGNTQMFTSTVAGGLAPYAYQWYYTNGTAILGATTSSLAFKANSSGTYTIYLNVTDNLNSKVKSNNATLNIYSQPTVTISPASANMTIGGSQQFTSIVSGGLAPYTYQWYYANNTAITGATTSTLTYKANSTGTYTIYLNATDSLSSKVKSNTVAINVYSQPTVTISPVSVNMTIGNTQQFNSTVSGGLVPYIYQWFYTNGTAITGATNSTLAYKANSTGTYNIYLNVTDNLNNKAKSNNATLTIYSQPTVTISPVSVNMTLGGTQQFNSSTAGGLVPYGYQWCYSNGTVIVGATTSTLTYKANSTGTYNIYLNVTDSLGSKVKSNTVAINVYSQPTVTIAPVSVNMTVGDMQQFNSTVSGGLAPYIYQWFYTNGTAITGATNSTLMYKANSTGTTTIYLNATDNLNNKAKSNNATLNIYSQPTATISPVSVNMTFGGSRTFTSVVLGGAPPYIYQWYVNGSAIAGASNDNFVFTPRANGNYQVYLNVTDSVGSQGKSNVA